MLDIMNLSAAVWICLECAKGAAVLFQSFHNRFENNNFCDFSDPARNLLKLATSDNFTKYWCQGVS